MNYLFRCGHDDRIVSREIEIALVLGSLDRDVAQDIQRGNRGGSLNVTSPSGSKQNRFAHLGRATDSLVNRIQSPNRPEIERLAVPLDVHYSCKNS